jgi:hypothetical protein
VVNTFSHNDKEIIKFWAFFINGQFLYGILIQSGGTMIRIFNSNSLSQNERFYKAIIYGIPTSIALAIIFSVIQRALMIRFSFVYLLIGYLIAMVIRKQGRGVQPKFAYLGAALAIFSIFFGDLLTNFGTLAFQNINFLIDGSIIILKSWLNSDFNNLIGLLFRAYAVYYAYSNSRIV